MNLDDIRSCTRPFYLPTGSLRSHKGIDSIHLAGNSFDFFNKNIGGGICFSGHAIMVMFAHPLPGTPRYAVWIKG
jgi:hypothetical protein